jgi:glycosyltransferase involved in cell wall biosynthesis
MARKTSVEVVIPIYNEEAELEDSIRKLHSYLTKYFVAYNWHITIADNASTDKSWNVAKKIAKTLPHVSVFHMDQKGRGRAVKKVWQDSNADIVSYMDVDLSTDLKNFNGLISALQQNADIAIGSRLLKKSKVLNRTPKREILSRGYNILIKLFFGSHFSDAQCGFKAVTRRVVKEVIPYIHDNEWFFDSELLILGEKMGYRIHEEPVYWVDNPGSTVRVLGTVTGDLKGLWRLFITRPWHKI